MITIYILKGVPASGKSTWAKNKVAEDPFSWTIINNDQIRAMCNNSVWSVEYEKLIANMRKNLIRIGINHNKNLIIDNVNADQKHWKEVCQLAQEANQDIEVIELPFYVELSEAIRRDGLRQGVAQVGEEVIRKFWEKLGGEAFKNYQGRKEILKKREVNKLIQDKNLPKCVVFDNDGTISLIHSGRSPYNASTADQDMPHEHVIECMKLYYAAGYKILFVSGREEKDRAPTEAFYRKHFPEVQYELYMRPTGNKVQDVLIKQEIYEKYIKDKYYVAAWFDDRLQIVRWLFQAGFPVFRANDPEATF